MDVQDRFADKPGRRRACLRAAGRSPQELDPEKPWRVMPLVPLAVSAPIGEFRDPYG